MQAGDSVQAVCRIVEEGFNGPGEHVHAEPGDVGLVVAHGELGPTVTWSRSGTTTDVAEEEIRFLRHFQPIDTEDTEATGRWVWAPCVCCDGIGRVRAEYEDGSEAIITCPACRGAKLHLVRL